MLTDEETEELWLAIHEWRDCDDERFDDGSTESTIRTDVAACALFTLIDRIADARARKARELLSESWNACDCPKPPSLIDRVDAEIKEH